jgi:glutamate decarboxylase
MPPAIDEVSVLRIVVRNGFTRDLAELFLEDLHRAVEVVTRRGSDPEPVTGFHH